MRILIGYDGTGPADEAIRDLRNAGLPDKACARVVIAPPPGGAFPWSRRGAAVDLEVKARRSLSEWLPGWGVDVEFRDAPLSPALLEGASAWGPDLLSLGWRAGMHGAGTIPIRFCRYCPSRSGTSRTILVAVDGCRDTAVAWREAATRAWPEGSLLRLIVARDSIPWEDASAPDGPDRGAGMDGRRASARLGRILGEAVDTLASRGWRASYLVADGDFGQVLPREARACGADCIFMARRRPSGWARRFFGRAADALYARLPCSLEIFPVPTESCKEPDRRGRP